MQKRDFETYQKRSEISRSCQNFPRPTFFEVPFATPYLPLFHHQIFHCSTVRCSIVPPSNVLLLHHLCSTLPASDVPLFHSLCSAVPPSNVRLFHRQMFKCSTITCFTLQPSLFYGSIIRSSTLPPSDVLLFRNLYSTVPLSYLPLFHHEMFHCSTIISSTVPPSHVSLFHHQMIYCPTFSVTLFHH